MVIADMSLAILGLLIGKALKRLVSSQVLHNLLHAGDSSVHLLRQASRANEIVDC